MNKLNELRSAAAANPVLLLFLGACPAMGASAELKSAAVLGLTVLAVCLLSSVIISAIRKFITDFALLWATVLISVGLSTIAQLLTEAYAPDIYPAVALYIAVCAVNLMVFSSSEGGIGTGFKSSLVFLGAVLLTALIREIFGGAALWGTAIAALENYKIPMLSKAPGGFLVFAIVLALFNGLLSRKGKESRQ